MEVKLGIGLSDIRFGLDQIYLTKQLGEPSKIDTDNDGFPLLQYNKLMCTFWIDEADGLHWIQCSNPALSIQGINIIGLDVDEAISKLKIIFGTKYEFEDYGSMESYYFQEHEFEVQTEYGVVTTVCFGNF
ncbi:hypothetical protein [Shewanella algae]|uniref:hypothetical protein n=1 Tax=Shewanella algae TaxID=38313 RepID=UPI003005412A